MAQGRHNMTKSRIVTGFSIVAGILALLYFLPVMAVQILVSIVFTLGAYEWAGLIGKQAVSRGTKLLYSLVVFIAIHCAAYFLGIWQVTNLPLLQEIMGLACLFWSFCLLWVLSYPQSALLWSKVWFIAVMGLLILIPSALAIQYLLGLPQGKWLFLFFITIVSLADTGAYFSGKQWGNKKLAPKVSPGKSWAGFFGGIIVVCFFALFVAKFSPPFTYGFSTLILVSILTVLASVLGDLVESMVKREADKKDSSDLLPGHGGIMDRIDSITAAAPVFVLLILLVK